MNALTVEWIEKAEGDYGTAGREHDVRQHPNYDAVCFHAQQTAEKYLKAYLQEQQVAPPQTHNLIDLLEACLLIDSRFATLRPAVAVLTPYAVSTRYPGYWAGEIEADEAFRAVDQARTFIRQVLVLSYRSRLTTP